MCVYVQQLSTYLVQMGERRSETMLSANTLLPTWSRGKKVVGDHVVGRYLLLYLVQREEGGLLTVTILCSRVPIFPAGVAPILCQLPRGS